THVPLYIDYVRIASRLTNDERTYKNLELFEVEDENTDEISISSRNYEISKEPFVVKQNAVSVVANTPNEATLTLTTCHPKNSARERLIVKARLIRSEVSS